ncbi:uncharacterized protein FIBRA_06013 [Fibroporia radiculosa]|uniref:P-loop containing nucleoside triphosphate hydrolase protein n=1 Tax=Fibroporia radiculosa TaxID=599839 RepID=J4GAI0_9APHY|nr:uncharacterized protein FIBRA_06013 [Fibroporia radiculosa]CCM03863.1 predicted protein [Fibroporia radiculosa]
MPPKNAAQGSTASKKRKKMPAANNQDVHSRTAETDAKRPRMARAAGKNSGNEEGKEKQIMSLDWPEYFDTLFKIFKALNTVLAFCSSRKSFAITFPVVRQSVEGLLKRPLELAKVAELKALLPEVVKFAYIPRTELRIHAESRTRREGSPDFAAFSNGHASSSQVGDGADEDEHVLVLDLIENSRGKKSSNSGFAYSLPPALSPEATKKLITKRNDRFVQAVNELLEATPKTEDPIVLLQAAARDHIPVDPSARHLLGPSQPARKTIPSSYDRPSVNAVIDEIMAQDWYSDQIVDRRTVDAKDGVIGCLNSPLSNSIQQALCDARKITSLYTHQVAAINFLSRGKSVIVSTSTASGKSVIYQVPLLRFLEDDPNSTAIFIYPTKALAQDQKLALEQLLCSCPGLEHTKVFTYDGDTPQDQRAGIRESASVIFTNFDMLHTSILPHEDLWRRFLKNLKLVAVDELHYYYNIFGSHVAQVMRRFRRVCAAIGNRRTCFVSCSATIANPRQHMQNIFGIEDIDEVTEDGAPSGRKDFLIWRAPLTDPTDEKSSRLSPMSEATKLMRLLMARGIRVILFCKIRKSCELAMKTLRAELTADGCLDILEKVMAYRGGYSQQDRRRIEKEAFSGNLLGIVATNALELGVDIGVLDAVLMLGFPMGGVASFRQQAGRAGRRARDALAVFVADTLPVDLHYVNAPNDLYDKPISDLVIDLDSKVILEAHLQCAAHELPLAFEDEVYFGPYMKEICETRLVKDREGWFNPHPKSLPFPAKHISLRGAQEDKYELIDITRLGKPGGHAQILEQIEVSRALFEIYEGGVAIIDAVDLDTPPWERESTGMWIDVPKRTLNLMRDSGINPAEAIHSAEHAILNRFALATDLRTECKVAEKEYKSKESQRKRPARLIFYEPTGKNSGVATRVFDHVSDILTDALNRVEACECEEGCVECIDSPLCKEGNEVSSKAGALIVLKAILGRPMDAELIPEYPLDLNTYDTVVEAPPVRTADGVQVEKA